VLDRVFFVGCSTGEARSCPTWVCSHLLEPSTS